MERVFRVLEDLETRRQFAAGAAEYASVYQHPEIGVTFVTQRPELKAQIEADKQAAAAETTPPPQTQAVVAGPQQAEFISVYTHPGMGVVFRSQNPDLFAKIHANDGLFSDTEVII